MDAQTAGSEITTEQVSREKLMADMRLVVADAEELLKATASQTGERIAAARARASESLQMAKARLAETQATVVEKVKVVAKSTDDYVHEKPWQSVGMAAAAGLVIGALISRR